MFLASTIQRQSKSQVSSVKSGAGSAKHTLFQDSDRHIGA